MTNLIQTTKTLLASLFLLVACKVMAQPNSCGVQAVIFPGNADSVVPTNSTIQLSSASVNAASVQWLLDYSPSGSTSTSFNYGVRPGVHTISLVAINGSCTDTTTVVYFSPGDAHDIDSLMLAHYGTYRYNEEGNCISKTPGNGFILGGVQYVWDGCGEAGVLVKLREGGCVDWSKKFLSPYYCNNSKVTSVYASPDSSYYVGTGEFELARLDKNGNLLWNSRYHAFSYPINMNLLTGDPQGNVYIVSWSVYFNGWIIVKIDKNGTVIWNKFFRLSYQVPADVGGVGWEYTSPSGITYLNGKIFVAGNGLGTSTNNYFRFLTKIDASTGVKEWQYAYEDAEFPNSGGFAHLSLYDTLLMVSSHVLGQTVSLIDQSGQVKKNINVRFQTSHIPNATKAFADSKGRINMMQWTVQMLPLQPGYQYYTNFAEIDTAHTKYWGLEFSEYSRPWFVAADMGNDDKFAALGTNFGYETDGIWGSRDMRILQIDTVNSSEYCFNRDTTYTITEKTFNRFGFTYLVDSTITITRDPGTPYTVTDAFLGSRYNCPDFLDSCSYVKLSGPRSVCNYGDTYTYRIHRNKKCALIPQLSLPAGVLLVSQTDSTLVLRFPDYGTYKVMAVLQSCIPSMDSIRIIVAPKNDIPLELGPDTVICPNNNIVLHAGPGFLSYLWSDGSTDSVFTAILPGKYLVEVTDSCGNLKKDSVNVMPFDEIINIGADRAKCNSDTVHLNAPPGYISYNWSNNYNISSTTAQQVIVNPAMDTAYYLAAEKYPGCFSYDTVRIKVNLSPPIVLGADKSFCQGDSAVLDAGAGFAQYQWSNGSSVQQTAVYSNGNYSVIGTTTEGCKSYDTLRVVNVWANPVVTLDDNPELCTGDTRVLNAGNFNSYQWQNGSTASSFVVAGTGTYYVTVRDNNQCEGSDTVRITRMLPLPAGFLPADTAICKYGSLLLTPTASFTNYAWSNNSVSSSINVTAPGIYWLEVTDGNDCRGKDSVTVNPKECLTGFHIPTAFTPDHDGRNDDFKPFIGGVVKQYQFTVYNRWGQVVFTTKDLSRGWDGTFGGIEQDTNVFAWICTYQLEGETVTIKKGTVVMIR